MDIQEEKDVYLGELLAREAIAQDQFDDLVYMPNTNSFYSKYLSARFIDNINWGWSSWQAAKAQAVPEGFILVPKELSNEKANEMAKEDFSKSSSLFYMEHRGEPDSSVERLKRIWMANKIRNLKLFHKRFTEAQEQKG